MGLKSSEVRALTKGHRNAFGSSFFTDDDPKGLAVETGTDGPATITEQDEEETKDHEVDGVPQTRR